MDSVHTTDTIRTTHAAGTTSPTPTIGVLVGSLSTTSINRTLARSLTGLIGERAHVTEIEIGDLPLYNSDLDETPPEAVRRFKREVSSVDGLIVVTP